MATLSYSDEMMLPIVSCSQEALPIVITRASLVVAGVVSIIDPETRVPPSTAMVPVDRVLQVRVFDAEVEDDEWQDRRRGLPDQLFQPHHAEGIISFAKVLEDECSTGGTIIVHCGHGQSRSTAVTAIVAAAWGASAEEAITASRAAHRASFTWDSARMVTEPSHLACWLGGHLWRRSSRRHSHRSERRRVDAGGEVNNEAGARRERRSARLSDPFTWVCALLPGPARDQASAPRPLR